jgi:hypothetical protein
MLMVSAGRLRSTRQPVACLTSPPTSRSISGEVNGKRLSVRRTLTRNDSAWRGPMASTMAAASRSKSCGARAAYEKLAMPKTRDRRSRASSHAAPAPSSISIRPITERTPVWSRPASAARMLRMRI